MSPQLVQDFRRVAEDERKHAEIFELLARVLENDDSLISTITEEQLVEEIRKVGIYFLPRRFKGVSVEENAVGSGSKVWCLTGTSPDEKAAVFKRILEESDLLGEIRRRADYLGKPFSSMKVVIKPTLMRVPP